jgi:hypothetical protein
MKGFFLFLFFLTTLYGYDADTLSHNKTWLKLLHFDSFNGKSSIVTQSFFLAKDGNTNPKNELIATLNGYENNSSLVCRYPARLSWLNSQLDLDGFEEKLQGCHGLQGKIKQLDLSSVSLVFVSGYMANPASTFGHTFIKLNSARYESDLLDATLSFGADVPQGENAFMYVVRGISGAYSGEFRDKYFLTHDMVYANTEQRDMWEYKLKIPQQKLDFLLLHILEIQGSEFEYYFFKKNCAYESANLLQLVVDEDLTSMHTLWYPPIEPFVKLSKTSNLVDTIKYHPSRESYLISYYQDLTREQQGVITQLIEGDLDFENQSFVDLPYDLKIDVLDFVLLYYNYKLLVAQDQDRYKNLKRKALLYRLRYKGRENNYKVDGEKLLPPSQNQSPFQLALGGGYSSLKEYYTALRLSPFSMTPTGKNSLDGNELSILDLSLGVQSDRVFVDSFDLIKVKKFAKNRLPFEEIHYSWELQVGVRNIFEDGYKEYDYFGEYGLGYSYHFEKLFFFMMVDGSLHTQDDSVRVLPKVGLRGDFGDLKIFGSLGYESGVTNTENAHTKGSFEGSYFINSHLSSSLIYEKDRFQKCVVFVKYALF